MSLFDPCCLLCSVCLLPAGWKKHPANLRSSVSSQRIRKMKATFNYWKQKKLDYCNRYLGQRWSSLTKCNGNVVLCECCIVFYLRMVCCWIGAGVGVGVGGVRVVVVVVVVVEAMMSSWVGRRNYLTRRPNEYIESNRKQRWISLNKTTLKTPTNWIISTNLLRCGVEKNRLNNWMCNC